MAQIDTPWFVGGGAQHAPEVARGQLFDSTGGAEGISAPGSLKVSALNPTGKGVRITPGGCLMLNRYPGGGLQSYSARWLSQVVLEGTQHFPDTPSGSGRTDLVVARVLDPQYEGDPPADPNDFEYRRFRVIQNVPASITSAEQLNLNYPAIALAKVTRPAATGHIQASHITDLRRLATPRRLREVGGKTSPPSNLSFGTFATWPNVALFADIPDWANYVQVIGHISGFRLLGGASTAELRMRFGENFSGFEGAVVLEGGAEDIGARDKSFSVGGRGPIHPTDKAKGVLDVRIEGRRTNGAGYFVATTGTHVIFDVQFEERAV